MLEGRSILTSKHITDRSLYDDEKNYWQNNMWCPDEFVKKKILVHAPCRFLPHPISQGMPREILLVLTSIIYILSKAIKFATDN